MKILHIIHSIDKSTGGPARSVTKTCVELAKLGVSIELLVQESSNKIEVPVTDNLTINYKTMSELFLYGSKLSNKEVDLIHLQHIWSPYIEIMAFWAYHKKIPYIITPRGMLEPWIMAQNPWKKKLGMFLYQDKAIKKAAHIHVTASMEEETVRALGYTNPITIIPNGQNLSEIKKIKTNYDSKKIVFISRIHPKKGIELLLEAWQAIDTQGWTLEIAGNGEADYLETLTKLVKDLDTVQFVGEQYDEDKWDFLRSAAVMVLPTFSENFGNVVVEALAVGVPVLTTKGAPWEDLEKYNCGWWIDLSVANLIVSLQTIIQTPPQELKLMGENGLQLINEKYDIKAVAKNMYKLYNKIIR